MKDRVPRRRFLGSVRRLVRRRGYWILVLGILASVALWRTFNAPRPVTVRAIITLPHMAQLALEDPANRPERCVRIIYPVQDLVHVDTPWDCRSSENKLWSIARLMQTQASPNVWRENGGIADMQQYDGMLIVDAPPALQEQVKLLLGVLRARKR
jgi:hypothetical protein